MFDHLPLTSLQLRQIELDRRMIVSNHRTQHHELVKNCVARYAALPKVRERRGVSRPWFGKRLLSAMLSAKA